MTEITNRTPTQSERFMQATVKQYIADVGNTEISDAEKTLMQHIFIRVDMAITEYNLTAKEQISWSNINMRKLAIDAVNRVKLGLDALIPGHMYAILYRNGKQPGVIDVNLRVGYKGEEYYTIKGSLFGLKRIYKRLVYGDEKLIVYPKGRNNPVESYELKLTDDPFNRGELKGGFAYLEYDDPELNELVVLSRADIEKRRKVAQSDAVWSKWYEEMALKTIIHAAAKRVTLDPEKINATALVAADVEGDYSETEAMQNANSTEIELEPPVNLPEPQAEVELPNPLTDKEQATVYATPNSLDDIIGDVPPPQTAPKARKRPF